MSARATGGTAKAADISMPAGFRDFALANPVKKTMAHFGVGRRTFVRWATECGIMSTITARARAPITPPAPKPMPEGFAQHVHLSIRKLQKVYPGLSRERIAQYRRELGVTSRDHSDRGTPVPADFATVAARKYMSQAARHYGVSEKTVRRWAHATGVRFQAFNFGGHAPQAMRATADASVAGLAAQHLRRSGYSNVYKADILSDRERSSLPNKGRGMYVVAGKGCLPVDEMIALAERSGFDRRAWARI